jgi:predicted regulator of Ras-like GTPase activity (Roadblock/LC7/MglB family)
MLTLNENQSAAVEKSFSELLASHSSFLTLILASVDGHALYVQGIGDTSAARVAAITSSLLGLSAALAKEVVQGDPQFIIADNSQGYVVALKINKFFTLTGLANRQASLGMLLSSLKRSAEGLVKVL